MVRPDGIAMVVRRQALEEGQGVPIADQKALVGRRAAIATQIQVVAQPRQNLRQVQRLERLRLVCWTGCFG